MNTQKTFGLLILVIAIQELINWTLKDYLIVGIAPVLIFGTIWNMKNGQKIYEGLRIKMEFNLKKFETLSIVSIVFLVVYMTVLNLLFWPRTNEQFSIGQSMFMVVSGLSWIFIIYVLYNNIDFVTRGLIARTTDKNLKWPAIVSLLFFPIGLLWIQPIINRSVGQVANNR
jgi:hypothetical protein